MNVSKFYDLGLGDVVYNVIDGTVYQISEMSKTSGPEEWFACYRMEHFVTRKVEVFNERQAQDYELIEEANKRQNGTSDLEALLTYEKYKNK